MATTQDLLLIFPPETVAKFFPYLSLPYLTGHLRRAGRSVHQTDLNLELFHRLLTDFVTDGEPYVRSMTGSDLRHWYRSTMVHTVREHLDDLRAQILDKKAGERIGATQAVQLAEHAVDLMKEGSFLVREWLSLDALDAAVEELGGQSPASYDLATRTLFDLLRQHLVGSLPRMVGLSIAYFSQLAPALLITRWVRRLIPNTVIILGGPQVTLRHDQLSELSTVRDTVDAVCVGAGEEPLESVLKALDGELALDEVPVLIWSRTPHGTASAPKPASLQFGDLGVPDFRGLLLRSYATETVQSAVVSCVGCYWGRCVFCSYGNRSLQPGSYQQGTPQQIADAVEHVVRAVGTDFVAIVDENTNLRLIVHAMREVRRRGLAVGFSTRNRLEPALLDPHFCQELADLGCRFMSVGYEGNSQRLLDLMDKGVEASSFQEIIDNLDEVGISVRFTVMGRLFDETPEEFEESLAFLKRNQEKIGIDAFQLMVAEPTSILVHEPAALGISLEASSQLSGNPELSHLGGMTGHSFSVLHGPGRGEALERLRRMAREVRPRISSLGPVHDDSEVTPDLDTARLQPWVRRIPEHLALALTTSGGAQGPSPGAIADLVWERLYAFPSTDIVFLAEDILAARSEQGRRLLADMVRAQLARVR